MRKILFIEGKILQRLEYDYHIEHLRDILEEQLSTKDLTFDLLEDILEDERNARHKLGSIYGAASTQLQSLTVVEYLGPRKDETCYRSNDVTIKIQLYKLYDVPRFLENKEFIQAEVTPMPHVAFDGRWDELVDLIL